MYKYTPFKIPQSQVIFSQPVNLHCIEMTKVFGIWGRFLAPRADSSFGMYTMYMPIELLNNLKTELLNNFKI